MIKAFITDLDGCLTDGCYFMFSHQEGIAKKLNTRDFHGMMLLNNRGIGCHILTLSRGTVIAQQIKRLPFPCALHSEIKDKKQFVENNFVNALGISWNEIAYIGDDVNDLELLGRVGVAACPVDAEQDVIYLVENRKDGWVFDRKGGEGCVRQFTNLVLRMV